MIQILADYRKRIWWKQHLTTLQVAQCLLACLRSTFGMTWRYYYGLEWHPMKQISAIFFFLSLIMYSNIYVSLYVTIKEA